MTGGKNPRILLVEDNPVDVQILKHALSSSDVPHDVDVADDGETALNLLIEKAELEQKSLPQLVILDLNLPKKSGLEVLREIKTHRQLRRIPVVVMSSSRSERDVNSAYDNGANLYVRKPNDLDSVEQLARAIAQAWLKFGVLSGSSSFGF